VIKHDVSSTRPDSRKSSADANVAAAYPSDLTSALVASRTDSSSSTIEIMGTFGKLISLRAMQGSSAPVHAEAFLRSHHETLTSHEREVMALVATGLLHPHGQWLQARQFMKRYRHG
jgi:hypothetical protein